MPAGTCLLLQVILTDSAGLRHTDCPIEAEGVRRAVAAAQQAHVVLHMSDAAARPLDVGWDEGAPELPLSPDAVHMQVLNKADLLASVSAATFPDMAAPAVAGSIAGVAERAASVVPTARQGAASQAALESACFPQLGAAQAAAGMHLISCRTGEGIEALIAALKKQVVALVSQGRGTADFSAALVTRARHRWVRVGEAFKQPVTLIVNSIAYSGA